MMSSCSEGSYNRKRQHGDDENIVDVDNDTTDSEDEGSDVSCPPLKKVRVSASAVHKEFEEVKDKSGKWSSKCKHCTIKDTDYSHKNASCLLIHLEKKHPEVYKKRMEDDKKERDAKRGERSHKDLQVKAGRSSSGHKTAARSLFSNNKTLSLNPSLVPSISICTTASSLCQKILTSKTLLLRSTLR